MKCRHFGICGGCSLQELSYEEQLLGKESGVKELFSSIPMKNYPIMAAKRPWGYRNKMEFSFKQTLKNERFLGLLAKKGRVVALEECLISPAWFTEAIRRVHAWWEKSGLFAYFPPYDKGSLRTLMVREGKRTGQKMVVLTVSGNPAYPFLEEHERALVEAFADLGAEDTLVVRKQIIQKKCPTRFEEKILLGRGFIEERLENGRLLTFRIRPSSFFQPHTEQAELLYRRALEMGELASRELIFDLYCGTGTIGIFASSSVERVVGIEINKDAVEDARANIQANAIGNMEVYDGEVEKMPADWKPTTIIVDPPRPGLGDRAIEKIVQFSPKKILYISCNPVTQVQDIKKLMERGFVPYALQPVDQFPHTLHVENIVALEAAI